MAASMWRMNGLYRSMAGLLLICTLLLSSEVMCQDDDAVAADPTGAPDAGADADSPDAADAAASSGATAAPDASLAPTVGGGGDSGDASVASADSFPSTIIPVVIDSQGGDTSETVAPAVVVDSGSAAVTEVPADPKNLVVPEVKCVGKEDIPEDTAVKAVVDTNDCEATKRIIQENAAPWCDKENCNLEIFQDGKTVSVVSSDASHHTLANALKSEHLKDKLGLTKVETPSSSGSSVFVGILVTGLLAAIAIAVGYFKCQRKPGAKGVKLAEEAVVDQENQGNTLVSVAPLNPPPETTEKPSVNGESPEAVKTESPPPTNGHSTTKTADTEL